MRENEWRRTQETASHRGRGREKPDAKQMWNEKNRIIDVNCKCSIILCILFFALQIFIEQLIIYYCFFALFLCFGRAFVPLCLNASEWMSSILWFCMIVCVCVCWWQGPVCIVLMHWLFIVLFGLIDRNRFDDEEYAIRMESFFFVVGCIPTFKLVILLGENDLKRYFLPPK